MQSAITRSNVLNLYKELFKQLNKNKSLFELIKNEFKKNSLTTEKYCKQRNEVYFIANAYLSYLKNTKDYLVLQAKYCKGERSIEEAAGIVGLKLPKTYQETENK